MYAYTYCEIYTVIKLQYLIFKMKNTFVALAMHMYCICGRLETTQQPLARTGYAFLIVSLQCVSDGVVVTLKGLSTMIYKI